MRRFVGDLCHPHPVLRRVEAVEGAGIQIELIAQYENKVSQCHGVALEGAGRGIGRCRGESGSISRQSASADGSWGTWRCR